MIALLAAVLLLAPISLAQTAPAGAVHSEATWKSTLDRVVPAVVSIRVTATRDFDTEEAGNSVGTGFVVDAERGIILTNRHMVHAGPVIAEAVFLDHEEVEIRAIYRDPVHDFGFYSFDPADVKFMDVVALPLAPEAAAVGAEVRVVGNDAGEKISILDGTIARLDRGAPRYGGDTYNDFNTFYLQAASGTSGGSSGSPVIDIEGRAIALNAGGRRDAASSYYLPLYRVVRALDLVRAGQPIPRGTIQTVFEYTPYDEVRRLGMTTESEAALREAFPEATGVMVVDGTVPGGPAWDVIETGDVLVRADGALVNDFVVLEELLDSHVGEAVVLEVERGGKAITATLKVDDLHGITPSEFLEVGRGVVHQLSYHQARNHEVPVAGVYVAVGGYMFGRASVPEGAILTAIDGEPVPDLDTFQRVIESKPHGQRMGVRYHTIQDPRRDQVAVVTMDRLWFSMRRCVRDDTTGDWPCTDSPDPPYGAEATPSETLPYTSTDKVAAKLAQSLVMVEFDIPYPTAGIKAFNYVGTGTVVDAERGWVLVDRDTVPVTLGDVSVLFGGSLRVPGRLVYLHPVHNLAVVAYDPALLGDTPVTAVTLSDAPLESGDKVYQVAVDRNHRVFATETKVDRVEPLRLGISATPRFRDYNVDGIDIDSSTPSLGGVLADKKGRVRAMWSSFVDQRDGNRTFHGLPVAFLPEALTEGGDLGDYCATGVELRPVNLADARERGLSDERARALLEVNPTGRRVFEVVRVMGGSKAQEDGIESGDLLLEVAVGTTRHVVTHMVEIEELTAQVCGETAGRWTVFRDGQEVEVPFRATPLSTHGTRRAVSWAGLIVHEPHVEVPTQEGIAAEGVYVAWLWYGSPGSRYGLRPTRRIVSIDEQPTPDLDTFLSVVKGQPDRQAVRIKTVALDGKVSVYTLKLDQKYWPLQVFARDEAGQWTRNTP